MQSKSHFTNNTLSPFFMSPVREGRVRKLANCTVTIVGSDIVRCSTTIGSSSSMSDKRAKIRA